MRRKKFISTFNVQCSALPAVLYWLNAPGTWTSSFRQGESMCCFLYVRVTMGKLPLLGCGKHKNRNKMAFHTTFEPSHKTIFQICLLD